MVSDTSQLKTIKIHSELARLADATGEDLLLRIWYGLRLLSDGRGWLFDTKALRSALLSLGVASSKQTLRRLLKRGDGLWWHLNRHHQQKTTIGIVALKKVSIRVARKARAKGVRGFDRAPGRAVIVGVQELSGPLSWWRSLLFKVWVIGQKHQQKRIDWATLEQSWSRSRTTLRERCQQSGVAIVHNWAVIPAGIYLPDNFSPWKNLPLIPGAAITLIDEVPHLIWQRPNTYQAEGEKAAKGMSRKVHQAVRHALDIPPRAYISRQYFDDPQAFAKARNRELDRELYLLTKSHPWGQFWEVSPAMR